MIGTKRIALFLLTLAAVSPAQTKLASDSIPPARLQSYPELAVNWMREYLRIDTSNPPGNEMRAAVWFKKILDEEGIENRVFEYAPGRGNVWARIPATSAEKKRPLILLSHEDVVTSDAARWKLPPFSGAITDGVMYGRGAQDMKCEGLAHLLAMVMLKREKVRLDRDVIFLATADEEVDDTGTDWMIAHERDLLGNAEFLITEGGENPLENGKVTFVGVDVAEKAPFWLHLVAHGRPGHGSRPIADSAPDRLVRALQRLIEYKTELKVLSVTERFLAAMAAYEPPERARQFRHLRQAVRDRQFQQEVERDGSLNYMLRNTISLTMLGGSPQTNVIPGEAWANLDVRLLPGEDPRQFLELVRRIVADDKVSVEPLKPFKKSNASPIDTSLMSAIRSVCARYFQGTPVVPRLSGGYTENERFRQLGVVSYGFSPYTATPEEGASEHGDNERIRIEELRRGFRVMYNVVAQLAAAPQE
ncbi:MAG: M20/M25/M40 family metallo-hydrolase [Acidobacteriia bacterium]|nr:M20/M25/M40 family metallo-hydrolase [Terriglobia bacterium]